MQPVLGEVATLPPLDHVRDIEAFEGPLLSERRAPNGSLYVEKWCDRDPGHGWRTLLVPVERSKIVDYVLLRISLLDLLRSNSDIGYVVDYKGSERVRVLRVRVSRLPDSYLPRPSAMHDPSLA